MRKCAMCKRERKRKRECGFDNIGHVFYAVSFPSLGREDTHLRKLLQEHVSRGLASDVWEQFTPMPT